MLWEFNTGKAVSTKMKFFWVGKKNSPDLRSPTGFEVVALYSLQQVDDEDAASAYRQLPTFRIYVLIGPH